MKVLFVFAFVCLAAWPQTPPAPAAAPPAAPAPAMPDLPDDTVVAILDDGHKMTMAEFKKIWAVMPQQNQQMALRDKTNFIKQWALMRKIALMAEKDKLDEQSPTKEALNYYRMMILSQAEINSTMNSNSMEGLDADKYYQANKEKYKQVKVKAIYIPFSTAQASQISKGKPVLTEEAAKTKAEKVAAEARGGADFVKLVKENSEDEASKSKDGDFATLRPNDNVPDAIRSVVFQLKQGEISDPVRQSNGFYVLKASEVSYRPLQDVEADILSTLRQQRFKKWMDGINEENKVTFPTPAFLSAAPAPAPSGK
ncbi:MAG TPA: peptidylprolyl isomerase [Bryobacteraceae bacterium]